MTAKWIESYDSRSTAVDYRYTDRMWDTLLATVVHIPHRGTAVDSVMWTTYGPSNAMGYVATIEEAKACAVAQLAIQALESS